MWWTSWGDSLRRLDHGLIYCMISGSFTPWIVIALRDWWGRDAMLVWIWMLAAMGMVFKFSVSTLGMKDAKRAARLELIGQVRHAVQLEIRA